MGEDRPFPRPMPQPGRERLIVPSPIAVQGTGAVLDEPGALARIDDGHVFMMGDNPALPRMPDKPRLLDFFRLRLIGLTGAHLLGSARRAMDAGQDEPTILACLPHDISVGGLIRGDHGYWGAQMIAPYVSEEIAFAVRYHQALRYFADPESGYPHPDSYDRFFGEDYVVPHYIRRDADFARAHRWYGMARAVTINDLYFFERTDPIDPEIFADIIGRHFHEPEEGLGFDASPSAHMWRTMIWPNNFL